ncbi:LuxR C-terminal-related transcriptional regulator [Enterobacter hormaechei]
MIYIVSDNFYLCEGIKKTLYPIEIKTSDKHNFERDLSNITSNDLLLLDSTLTNLSLDGFKHKNNGAIVFILNHSKNQIGNFNALGGAYYSISILISVSEFYSYILSAISGDVLKKLCSPKLTLREKLIFNESLKGLTVKEISINNGISAKSVYAQRTSACRKLGFESHRVIWMLPLA